MRVVVLSAAYPAPSEPERAVFIENLNRALALELDRRGGGSITVVAPRVARSDPRREERRGMPVRRFSYPGGGRRLKEIERPSLPLHAAYAASALATVLDGLRASGADCLLCHWVLPTGPVAAIAASWLRVPLVLVAHGSDLNVYARSSALGRALARFALRRAARIVAVSSALREAIVEEFGADRRKVEVVPMGVDGDLFVRRGDRDASRAAARRRLGLDPDAPALLFVGDLSEEKGAGELIACWRSLERDFPLELWLVGGGALPRSLANGDGTAPAAARGLRFAGRRPQEELVLWYEAADLFVLPSRAEGSPVSVMEALSLGVPVVATRVGGIPEIVAEGRTGRLVRAGDARALAVVVREILEDRRQLEALRAGAGSLPPDAFSAARRAREFGRILEDASCEARAG